ncbi:neural cell adhesion molecule 1a isoform X4 [Scleropages formosus]|uniref:neural cell adhesion molecule 1a isoform X4 n=1 Tax=Scleropages formosus TaxID=113540 RepID=UPI0008791696|nr:neural cell adhesion molecule 1 isoform X4 [Scleropages formosus]
MLQARDIIWALLFFGTAASLQVNITPAQGEISVGESKFFQCEVVGEAKEIDWYSPSGEKILPNRQDISVTRNDEESSILTIYNANIDNAGIYKCVARNGNMESQATVNVKIYQKLTFKSAPSPQEFNEGDNADIVCDVVSSPPPAIIWRRGNTKIQVEKDVRFKILDNNHLQIRGIKKTDEGSYTCEGRIMARGEIDFRVIEVIINVLPTIRTRHAELNATADIGQSVMLACDADGYPEPRVTWARNNIVLETSDKYSINEDGSEMIIKNIEKVDEGEYTCIAKNKAGEKEAEVSLNVFVQPKITYLKNQTASELEEQVTLTCEATGDPTPTIVWSFGRQVFSEGEQSLDDNVVVRSHARVSSLTLKYVQFTDAGQYLCTARNAIGQDAQSMYLEVRYAPKIQGLVTVYTWEGNAANISCEVLAHPGAVVMWFRDGQQLPSANTTNVKIYNTPAVSFLEVTPDSQTDFGSYNCTATNIIGSESKEFLLIQADVPSAPTIEQVEPYSSTALMRFDEPDATGGVPVLKYKVLWRAVGQVDWTSREYEADDGGNTITIVGLKPETNYEVKMSAINGKGEGESSLAQSFKTEPVHYSFTIPSVTPAPISPSTAALKGEPSPPKLEGKLQSTGNTLKVNWIKQDDGGSPIKHYLVRYKAKHASDWKPEMRLPSSSEYVMLSGLDWNTEYEVYVVAENQQGKSQPGTLSFRTSAEPTAIPDPIDNSSGLGTGAIVGILIVVFVLLLVGVDITCYFLNKCGLLMCIAVNFCGKAGPGAKSKDLEEGKASFTKDESKEPIVEVRTEEERTPNHEAGGQTEPNETTPLTEPEPAADTTAAVVDLLPSVATNSDTVTENSPASESTTLTSSAAVPPAANAKATPPVPQSSTPKPSITSPSSTTPAPSAAPKEAPLVDLSEGLAAKAEVAPATNGPEAAEAMSNPTPASDPSPTPTSQPTKADATKLPGSEAPQATAKSLPEPSQNPTATDSAAKPSHNQDLQIDGGPYQTSDTDLAKDVFDALGKPTGPPADSTAVPTPAQDEKIVVADDKSKPEETEVKKTPSEVKTVPNEAAQTNGNESKA